MTRRPTRPPTRPRGVRPCRRAAVGLAAVALAAAGCNPERIEATAHARWRKGIGGGLAEQRQQLQQQAAALHTVTGAGVLQLGGPDGRGVVLDVVAVLALPDRARVRASKFGHAVFDMTVTPAGVWVAADDDRAVAAGATAAQVSRGLSLLGGGFFDDPAVAGRFEGDELVFERHGPPDVVCRVDGDRLLPTTFQVFDEQLRPRFTLDLSEYQRDGQAAWPLRIVGSTAGHDVATIRLDQVEINADLPATAFDPPPRARRLP